MSPFASDGDDARRMDDAVQTSQSVSRARLTAIQGSASPIRPHGAVLTFHVSVRCSCALHARLLVKASTARPTLAGSKAAASTPASTAWTDTRARTAPTRRPSSGKATTERAASQSTRVVFLRDSDCTVHVVSTVTDELTEFFLYFTFRKYTFKELHVAIQRAANALRALGVRKGTTVALYMPMVPEAVIAMLACARLGAPHNTVFAVSSTHVQTTEPEQSQVEEKQKHKPTQPHQPGCSLCVGSSVLFCAGFLRGGASRARSLEPRRCCDHV